MSADHAHEPPLPPEPQTPMWLPVLGAVLFFVAAVWFLAGSAKDASGASAADDAGVAADSAR